MPEAEETNADGGKHSGTDPCMCHFFLKSLLALSNWFRHKFMADRGYAGFRFWEIRTRNFPIPRVIRLYIFLLEGCGEGKGSWASPELMELVQHLRRIELSGHSQCLACVKGRVSEFTEILHWTEGMLIMYLFDYTLLDCMYFNKSNGFSVTSLLVKILLQYQQTLPENLI